jgi:oligopeptide transport system substrate-binding protein
MQQASEVATFIFTKGSPDRIKRMGLVRCSVLGLLIISNVACDSRSGSHGDLAAMQHNAVLRRGLPGDPRTLDPQLADDQFSLQVVRDLYEGLTAEDSSGRVVPGIAASWTVDEAGTAYVFHLRGGAKWSNGSPLTAKEFVDGLRRAVDPKTGSGDAVLLSVVKGATDITSGHKNASELGVAATDDSTVRIELEHPAPFILQILSQPIAAPSYEGAPLAAKEEASSKNLGPYDGPYVLAGRIPGSFIDLTRNENYWNASNVAVEKVRYVNVESEATEMHEYIAGELDMTFTLPLADFKRITEQLGPQVQIDTTLGTTFLALNLSTPELRNHDVREALSIAVDREAIAQHVLPGVQPAYTLVASGSNGYTPPKYEWMDWDRAHQLALSKSLYARAGYSEKKPLRLRLYSASGEANQRVMIAIAGSWKQNLGVISELISEEFRVFLVGRKDKSRWDVERVRWDADYDDPSSFLDVLAPGSNENDPGYNNPRFSELIRQATVEPRPSVRLDYLRNAEESMLNDYPIIPIYFVRSRRLVKPYVGGAQINPMDRTYSKNLFWR